MRTERTAQLILENGMRFTGRAFGHVHDAVGEVIFTTGMTGYQEEITDPAYCGQIVVMTYPLIGNYGINFEDMESDKPALAALVVREKCDYPNNFRTETDLDSFLKQKQVLGLEGIDTRALTRTIRDNGCMRGLITTQALSEDEVQERFADAEAADKSQFVSTQEQYTIQGEGAHVAFLDLGTKASLLKELQNRGCRVTVFPYDIDAAEIAAVSPDAVFVSSGPGDPRALTKTIETVRALSQDFPVLGIGNGHLVVSLALGCTVEKMRFGHHGGNYPAKNCLTGSVSVVAQNHLYAVTKVPDTVEITYVNANDGSCEGIRHKTLPVRGVQFQPEASDLPEIAGIFDNLIAGGKENA